MMQWGGVSDTNATRLLGIWNMSAPARAVLEEHKTVFDSIAMFAALSFWMSLNCSAADKVNSREKFLNEVCLVTGHSWRSQPEC